MTDQLVGNAVVSPYKELMSFEYLYAFKGTSRSKVSKIIEENGGLPSKAVTSAEGFFPDKDKQNEVIDYVRSRLGNFSILVDGTPQFPDGLRGQKNPLPIFYYRGDISLTESRCVSVVDTRHPDERGAKAAKRLTSALARRGITVVMGLAAGIDTIVARTALDLDGHVVGVIGTPIHRYYPKENHSLQDLVATKGLLISQVPIYRYDHQPFKTQRYYFPERNITMAALSEATVIVEAGETSGTRTQAKACIDQHKKLILLPEVAENTTWGKKFLDEGAVEAHSVADVLSIIGA